MEYAESHMLLRNTLVGQAYLLAKRQAYGIDKQGVRMWMKVCF